MTMRGHGWGARGADYRPATAFFPRPMSTVYKVAKTGSVVPPIAVSDPTSPLLASHEEHLR